MLGKMGATVAIHKCVIMANNRKEVHHRKQKIWGRGQMEIPVELHWRDLGAHLGMHGSPWAGTLTERMTQATVVARRIAGMPVNYDAKVIRIQSKVLPMALCGSEACSCPQAESMALEDA